ncbi:hypothetical protein BSL82_03410 [Tardibacter chloracetimidivorans]|uniref:Uncharacterized protein n=1 Tax=Tardibacter chloracetimidivorans TaxID=1921510 RepID=A0A1L3ZS69_9SPHN|nr:hypothetical protein [Tardibacter chloracetimidivorans]API58465.1 hypothetical protein BSL82_03410 [Tardibacter chloracetimidivorans]
MGGIFGSKTKTKTNTDMGPWSGQQPYVKDAFAEAQNIYNSQQGTPWYQGDIYAGMDPFTQQAVQGTNQFATGTGSNLASGVSQNALAMGGMAPQYGSAIDSYYGMATGDPTQQNIANAGMYAANPYLDDQIDAVGRDISRNLSENELPSIDRAATGTGNVNSTRAGVAEGVALRGAQDRFGDISASMRGDAYSQGLQMAEAARQYNTGATGNAAQLYGQGIDRQGQQSALASDLAYQNLSKQSTAGQMNQQDQQGELDALFKAWQGGDTRAADLLNRYYGIVGSNNWGQTGTTNTTQKSSPGIGQVAMGLGSMAAGAFGLGGGGGLLGLGGGATGGLSAGLTSAMSSPLVDFASMAPSSLNFGKISL